MKDTMAAFIAGILMFPLFVGGVVLAFIIDGVAFRTLWNWFVAPQFHLPTFSLTEAIGLGIVISLCCKQYIPSKRW